MRVAAIPGAASRRRRRNELSSKHELRHQLAGARLVRDARCTDGAESGNDRRAGGAAAVGASRQFANRSGLRARQTGVVEIGAIEDVLKLHAQIQAHSFLVPELPSYGHIYHGPAFPSEGGGVRRAAILPRRWVRPGGWIQHKSRVGIEAVAVEVLQKEGLSGHAQLVLTPLENKIAHRPAGEGSRIAGSVRRGGGEWYSAGVVSKAIQKPVAQQVRQFLRSPLRHRVVETEARHQRLVQRCD